MFAHRLTHYALLLAVMAILTFPNLGTHSLWDVDEGVNAEATREMREIGTILTPIFNFELRTAKPVMINWLQLMSFSLFGVSEWAARMPSVLMAMLTVLLTYELARRMFDWRTGLISGIVLASAFEFCLVAHAATPDSPLLFFTVLTFYLFWIGSRNGGRGWFLPCGAAAGLAMLTKGPVGLVLPGAVIFFYFLWNRELKRLVDRRVIYGFLIFLLVCAPWYVLVTVETRGVWIREFLTSENAARFTQSKENHGGPIFYHVLGILVLFTPWSGLLIATVWESIRDARRLPNETAELSENQRANRLLLVWIGTYLCFFSLAATKLPNYVLPVYPALAMLTGRLLEKWRANSMTIAQWVMPVAIACLAGVGILYGIGLAIVSDAMPLGLKITLFPALRNWIWLGFVPIVGATLAGVFLRRQQRNLLVGTLAATAVAFVGLLAAFPITAIDQYKSPRALIAQAGLRQPQRDIRLMSLQWFQPSLVYYSQREVARLQLTEDAARSLDMKHPVYLFVPEPVWQVVQREHPRTANHRTIARHFDMYKNCDILVVTNQ